MRILHTADWHLGRVFHRVDLLEDQRHVLEQLLAHVRDQAVDVVLIAGDIYDRSLPPADAVRLLDDTLATLVIDCNVHVVVVAGNHDSMTRIGFASRLLREQRLHLFGRPGVDVDPLLLADEHGEVAIFGIPYPEPGLVRELVGDEEIHDHQAAMAALVERILPRCPPAARSVLVSHADVDGGRTSESERALSISRPQSISASTFEAFDYVALGHLHRPQPVAANVRYSGSILPYSFSEAGDVKSVTLVELGARGDELLARELPLEPRRRVRCVEGELEALLREGEGGVRSEDYLRITLLDEGPLFETVTRLRRAYPNLLEIERPFLERELAAVAEPRARRGDDELAQFAAFYQHATGEDLDESLRAELTRAVELLRKGEA